MFRGDAESVVTLKTSLIKKLLRGRCIHIYIRMLDFKAMYIEDAETISVINLYTTKNMF
jgi:hypothetical protein